MLNIVRRYPILAVAVVSAAVLVILALLVLTQPAVFRSATAWPVVAQAQSTPMADMDTPAAQPADLTRTDATGAVTVQVTPLNLFDAQATRLDFTVVLDTHSVDLSMDLSELAILIAGERQVAATAWLPAGDGGHHLEGLLTFPATDAEGAALLEGTTAVTLSIRDLADVAERTFNWDLANPAEPAAGPMPATTPGMGTGMGDHAMMGNMPMGGDMAQMMEMMQGMMGDMPMEDHQAMMDQMMPMMQGMMAMMEDMPMQERQAMMDQMMPMMQSMMAMMKDMPMQERQAMMGQMMAMMQGMMGMAHGDSPAPAMPGMDHGALPDMDDHMAAIPSADVPTATEHVGGQPLDYRDEDGVKVFELTAQAVRWTILETDDETVEVTAWTYNGTVPGPMIRVTEGDRVRIHLTNQLDVPTSIHWHGIPVPNAMDGVPPITQAAIQPGETFTYEFDAPPAGSFMYHSHVDTDVQVMVGLYAPFIVDPQEPEATPPDVDVMWMLSEWRVGPDGETYPAMPMAGAEPNYFTINGKAFPSTEPIVVRQGERVRIRLAGIGQFVHPMHLHGMNFRIVAYDGVALPPEQQIVRNTIPINPGELVDIEFVADNLGTWLFHCHVLHHVTNGNVEPGGLIGVIQVIE